MSFLKKLLKGGLPGKNGLPKNLPGANKVPAPPGFGGGGKPKLAAANVGVRDTSGGIPPRAGDAAAASSKPMAERTSFLNPDRGTRLYPDSDALKEPMRDRALKPSRY